MPQKDGNKNAAKNTTKNATKEWYQRMPALICNAPNPLLGLAEILCKVADSGGQYQICARWTLDNITGVRFVQGGLGLGSGGLWAQWAHSSVLWCAVHTVHCVLCELRC